MKLFATDLDGTTVHGYNEIEESSIAAIKRMQENGILVAVSTGRILGGVKFLKEDYGLNLDYYVLGNGSVVMDKDYNLIYKKTISYDMVREMYNHLLKCPIEGIMHASTNDGLYFLSENAKLDKEYFFKSNIDEISNKEIVSFVVSFEGHEEEVIENIAKEMKEKFTEVEVFQNKCYIDVAPKNSSKASGIEKILDREKQVKVLYTIGDSYNDIPMLEMTENSFTFVSSPEAIKKSAKNVVENFAESVNKFVFGDK